MIDICITVVYVPLSGVLTASRNVYITIVYVLLSGMLTIGGNALYFTVCVRTFVRCVDNRQKCGIYHSC